MDLIPDPTLQTVRIAFSFTSIYLGKVLGKQISGVISNSGYAYVWILSEFFLLCATFSAIFLPQISRNPNANFRQKIVESFDYRSTIKMAKLLVAKRPGKKRFFLLASFIFIMFDHLLEDGQSGVLTVGIEKKA